MSPAKTYEVARAFGQVLRTLRKGAGLTQEQLAEVVSGREARLLREAAVAAYERLGAAPYVERLRVALV